jgi:transcriptional regulator with XRE-family HTH domain
MDGKSLSGGLLGDLRRDLHLSQRALAELSGIPQPTLSEIESGRREPSFSLLSRIAESVGYTFDVQRVPLKQFGSVATARAIKRILGEQLSSDFEQDAALRVVLDLRDALLRSPSVDETLALVRLPPEFTGDARWDAFLAAVVEDECARRNIDPPRWINDPRRFVKPFWHLSDVSEFREWEFRTAPASFLRHGVLATDAELASV